MAPASRSRFSVLIGIVFVLGIVFLGIQFIRPALNNSPVTAELQAPPQVREVLRTSCYGCHSNETKLSWFDQVVPAYWLVASDVNEARKHLNFSEIGKLPAAQQKAALFEAVNQIQLGAMPLPSYRRMHPGAAVTAQQLAVLRDYLDPPTSKTAAVSDTSVADAEYAKWIQASGPSLQVQPVLNGIEFLPDYKNWKAISSTDRFDNHTMRQILGNDVAVKAIAENHINPWPDGTTFAKVAWLQHTDDKGVVRTGAFYQVEFMIRDSKKYASTKGWGWARWRGDDLKPYGKDAAFSNECISCHTPVRKNDYVYTMPIKGQQ
ncbi:MAG TPA: heme-binding domain-containing protein [Edaphobacter sp.]|nr:heme-binding domain-containing protein [Edaphobacter sp.]